MNSPPARHALTLLGHLAICVLFGAVFGLSLAGGLAVRRWAWDFTEPVHFLPDITRGYAWGQAGAGPDGYLNAYDKMANQGGEWRVFLDYAPLRLGVMTLWAKHNQATEPDASQWQSSYEFNRPVLWFNAGMELIGVVAAFFIVRRVVLNARRPLPVRSWSGEWFARLRRRPLASPLDAPPRRPFAGWPTATAAAVLLWFNPTMILSAHGWPQWDIWVVPMYLLALLAAVYDAWLLAGLALAIGVMFKGQQMVGAPVFLAWTLLQGRWTAALRYVCGFAIGLTIVAAPWLLTYVPAETLAAWYHRLPNGPASFSYPPFVAERLWNWRAIAWTLSVLAAAVALPLLARRRDRWMAIVWPAAGALLVWPIWLRHDVAAVALLVGGAIAVGGASLLVRSRTDRAVLAAATVAGAMLSGIAFFGASSAWWTCGVVYGTYHYPSMTMGMVNNLPGLLSHRFGYGDVNEVLFSLPPWTGLADVPVTMGLLLRSLFVLSLVPCLWGVARHARRHDPRLLVAVTAPWLMFVCFPAQIHERYMIYPAAIGSILIGQSLGMTLLALLLSGFAFMQSMSGMLQSGGTGGRREFGAILHAWQPDWFSPQAANTLNAFIYHTYPDAAWAVLLIALIFIYTSACKTKTSPVAGPL